MSASAKPAAPWFEGSPVCGLMATFASGAEPVSVSIVFSMTREAGRRKDDVLVHRSGVTVMASHSFVSTIQCEAGACVVIEVPNFPIPRIVTILASRAQSSMVGILALMTRIAVNGCFVFIERAFVATVALRRTMLAEQRICGVPIVFKEQGFPVLFGMTTFAGLTEPACMLVVLPMAGVAAGRCLVFVEIPLMAQGACCREMLPTQWVVCLEVVIEGEGLPIVRTVACLASFSICPFMRVVLPMAAIAVHRRVFKRRGEMAGLALDLDMFP